jgi:riboflavin transporter FmnP
MRRSRAEIVERIVYLKKISLVTGMIALAVILKFYEIPHPLASYLKYDASEIPLTILSILSIKYALSALPIYYLIPVLTGFDPIGMFMKTVASLSTFIPLTIIFRRFKESTVGAVLSITLSILSRVAVMTFLNLIVTPFWLVFAGWAKDLESAWVAVLYYLPQIIVFNVILGFIVASSSIGIFRVVRKTLYNLMS